MTRFGDWTRALTLDNDFLFGEGDIFLDLANLAAQLEEALVKLKKRYPRAITGEAALAACKEFMEKYQKES